MPHDARSALGVVADSRPGEGGRRSQHTDAEQPSKHCHDGSHAITLPQLKESEKRIRLVGEHRVSQIADGRRAAPDRHAALFGAQGFPHRRATKPAARSGRSAHARVISCFSVHNPEGPDTARGDDPEGAIGPDEPESRSGIDSGTEAFVSEADAEDEVAKAEARVESTRARVERLRRAAEAGDAADDAATSYDAADTQDVEQRPTKSIRTRLRGWRPSRRPRWRRRPGRKAVAVGAGIVLASTSLGAIGYMLQQHHNIAHKRQLSQEYATAARQAVTTLMSIDANHAKDDIQRIIDASTGPLKDQMSVMSSLMLKQAEESKTITKVNVEAVAVESATENSAVALVVAKTDVTDTGNTRPPQLWRLSIELVRDGGQLKMSKVDFLQ